MGSRAVGAPLRRRPRDAHPAGDHPRHRRRAGVEGARIGSGGVSPQRGSCGVRRPPAHSRPDRAPARRSTRRWRKSAPRRSSRRTRRCRPATTRFRFTWSRSTWPDCWGTLGANRERFLALGSHDAGAGAQFNMTALAMRSAGAINARQPAARHGDTRDVGPHLAGDAAEAERPVGAGDQRRPRADLDCRRSSRISSRSISVPTGATVTTSPALWDGVLGDSRSTSCGRFDASCSRYLFTFIRERARQRWTEERVGIPRVVAAGTLLEPDALTLGFARRFAGYKRPELVFHDPERLARILNAPGRPVQIIFAGKSHPADDIGKHHLQRVYKRALDPLFGGRVAFVDDYDLHVAHFLVQGCDVWLNTPRKPLEASGTSGMKAAINGVPHLSIGDGWWAEGFNGTNGWVIDGGVTGENHEAVDAADASALYRLLEEDVVPAFYDRDQQAVPHRWMATVKESIRSVAPRFSARRMVKEYAERMYAPSGRRESWKRSDLPADRRMVNDLDRVPVRIREVARASPVAMRAGHGVDGDAAALQKCRPPIDISGGPDDRFPDDRACRGGPAASSGPLPAASNGAAQGCRCPTTGRRCRDRAPTRSRTRAARRRTASSPRDRGRSAPDGEARRGVGARSSLWTL